MEENAPVQIARPYVVIVTPTRELCTQIYNEARKFSQGSIIKCCQIYGGTASRHQNTNLNVSFICSYFTNFFVYKFRNYSQS